MSAISTALAVRMMSNAGMGENAIIAAFASLLPVATMDGGKYWNPAHVAKAIKDWQK